MNKPSVEGGAPRVLAYLYGGQRTINVPSWPPDSKECFRQQGGFGIPRMKSSGTSMRRGALRLAVATCLVALGLSPPALGQQDNGALPYLRVAGNRLVDEAGAPVVLRGVSFSDPDRLEQAGQWNRAYFEAAQAWNANVVRFPVHPRAWRARGEEDYLRLLDQGIAWATDLGMYVIIDWHSIGNHRGAVRRQPRRRVLRSVQRAHALQRHARPHVVGAVQEPDRRDHLRHLRA